MANSKYPPREIREAITDEEIAACFPVVHELRPHVPSAEELVRRVKLQQQEMKYHLAYIKDTVEGSTEAKPVSIIGYGIIHCLFYGRQMYIYDLCTISTAKRKGYAGSLIDFVVEEAKRLNCDCVTLDSGHARADAHRLYMNKKFAIKCHHFCLDLKS